MKIKTSLKFQEGGMAPAPVQEPMGGAPAPADPAMGGAPMPEQGEDPIMQLAQIAAQAVQSGDCQAAMTVCEAFLQLIQEASGGGAAPEPAPEQPAFQRKGGKLVKKG